MMILFHTTIEQYSALHARVAFLSLFSLGIQFILTNDTAHLLSVHEPGGEDVAAQEGLMEAITYEEP